MLYTYYTYRFQINNLYRQLDIFFVVNSSCDILTVLFIIKSFHHKFRISPRNILYFLCTISHTRPFRVIISYVNFKSESIIIDNNYTYSDRNLGGQKHRLVGFWLCTRRVQNTYPVHLLNEPVTNCSTELRGWQLAN